MKRKSHLSEKERQVLEEVEMVQREKDVIKQREHENKVVLDRLKKEKKQVRMGVKLTITNRRGVLNFCQPLSTNTNFQSPTLQRAKQEKLILTFTHPPCSAPNRRSSRSRRSTGCGRRRRMLR